MSGKKIGKIAQTYSSAQYLGMLRALYRLDSSSRYGADVTAAVMHCVEECLTCTRLVSGESRNVNAVCRRLNLLTQKVSKGYAETMMQLVRTSYPGEVEEQEFKDWLQWRCDEPGGFWLLDEETAASCRVYGEEIQIGLPPLFYGDRAVAELRRRESLVVPKFKIADCRPTFDKEGKPL